MEKLHIHMLIHPGYNQNLRNASSPSSEEVALQAKWDNFVENIKNDDRSIMLYFSYIDHSRLDEYRKTFCPFTAADEMKRIDRYERRLGDKFVLYGVRSETYLGRPTQEEIVQSLSQKGITKDQIGEIHAFGEYYEDCVLDWSKQAADALDMNRKKVRRNRGLSLTTDEARRINKNDTHFW